MEKEKNNKSGKSSAEEIERLNRALAVIGGSHTQICKQYGFSINTLRSWLNGSRAINKSTIKDVFAINPEYIVTGKEPMFIEGIFKTNAAFLDNKSKTNELKGVRFLTYVANMGMGFTFNDIQEIYEPDVKKSYKPSYIQVRVSGDSMYPTIKNGWRVTFDTKLEPSDDDLVCATVNGTLVVKRYRKQDNIKTLVSDNPKFESYSFNGGDTVKIHGVIVEISIY